MGGIVDPGGVRSRFVPLLPPGFFWSCASALPSPHAWVTGSREGETNVVVNSPKWRAIGNDLNSPVILGVHVMGAGGHPNSLLPCKFWLLLA